MIEVLFQISLENVLTMLNFYLTIYAAFAAQIIFIP